MRRKAFHFVLFLDRIGTWRPRCHDDIAVRCHESTMSRRSHDVAVGRDVASARKVCEHLCVRHRNAEIIGVIGADTPRAFLSRGRARKRAFLRAVRTFEKEREFLKTASKLTILFVGELTPNGIGEGVMHIVKQHLVEAVPAPQEKREAPLQLGIFPIRKERIEAAQDVNF